MKTIDRLVDAGIIEEIAGMKLERRYKLDAPKGVNGRNGENAKILKYMSSETSIRRADGAVKACEWIEEEISGLVRA